jgi:hypothetical protein
LVFDQVARANKVRFSVHVRYGRDSKKRLISPPVMLENPTVIESDRVTHLSYKVRRSTT